MDLKWLVLLALFLVTQSHGAKILGLYPFPSKSHLIVQKALMLELARRGHEVTILTAHLESKPVANLTEIPVMADLSTVLGGKEPDMHEMSSLGIFEMSMMMLMMGKPICEIVLQEENVQKLIHSKNLHFDLVVIEAFTNECMLGFAHKFNAPVIQVCPYGGTKFMADWVGSPTPYSYVPDELLNLRDKMSFGERMFNTLVSTLRDIGRNLITIPAQDEVMRKYFNYTTEPLPYITELEKRTALVLLNSHFSISYPKPLMPNYVQVGGMHVKPPKKLPADLQKYMDESPQGVVYFSMGSNLKGSQMPDSMRDALLKGFSKLKQNVLWKWEGDSLPGQPKNVKIGKWLPQSDILAHPNLKLFITHGGLLSTQEAVNRGVPVVGIPIFADQYLNTNRAVLSGFGLRLDLKNITEQSLLWAINEVIGNPSYRKNAQHLSRIYRDQPLTPLQQAVFWTEYVIRHKGAPHLRSAALDLSWYQYLLLDVIAVLALAAGSVFLVFFCILRALIRKCSGGGTSQKPKESIQKKKN